MGRKTGLFTPILLVGGILFFLMLGVMMLDHAPTPDENQTASLAESANEAAIFHKPVWRSWQGAAYAIIACAILAVLGLLSRRMGGGGKRRWY